MYDGPPRGPAAASATPRGAPDDGERDGPVLPAALAAFSLSDSGGAACVVRGTRVPSRQRRFDTIEPSGTHGVFGDARDA